MTMTEIAEEIDVSKTPPCEMQTPLGHLCKRPSVARVRLDCPSCCMSYIKFTCSPCLAIIRNGGCGCRICDAVIPEVSGYC